MTRFDYFEHTADIGIRGFGETFLNALESVSYGMFDYICNTEKIEEEIERHIEINAKEKEDQVILFLNKLIYLFETEHFIPVKYELTQFTNQTIHAVLHGAILDPSKNEVNSEVKAATYHNLKIKKDREWMIEVIVDV